MLIFIFIVLIIVSVDQGSKYQANKLLKGKKTEVIKNKLYFIYTENEGAFLGFLSSKKRILKGVALSSIVILIIYFFSNEAYTNNTLSILGFSFYIGGAISNLLDRFLRGKVIDFIFFNIQKWPVFNLADFFIFFGVGLIIVNEVL